MIGPYVIRADVDAGFAGTPEPTHVFEEITVSPPPEMMITPSPEVEDDMYRYMSSGGTTSDMYPSRGVLPTPDGGEEYATPTPDLESPEPEMF